ncbi:TRAP transporter small permease subunit [Aliikangiella maris]|uniref:TRAP transporter small permease subunit n=2 Tax=Aliikangiella maris TaxID=3162458 RepID=A0ABV3MUS3_9GAMM
MLKNLSNLFSLISVRTGYLISWLTVAMVVVLTINVLASWLLQKNSILLSESITWMHSANFLLAAAYTLNRDEHVRVDIFYQRYSIKGKAIVNLLGSLFLLIPTATFIFWASWPYITLSWRIGEMSAEAGGMPAIYLLKSLLIVMPSLLILEGINQIIQSISQISAPTSEQNTITSNQPQPGGH